jgi:cyclic pyranopterin phosphate synthase
MLKYPQITQQERNPMNLTHLDEHNKPKMVDVSEKANTTRTATASGIIEVTPAAFEAVIQNTAKKGPVLQTAVIAAIQGAKQTSTLIPMCHPLMLTSVKTDIEELPQLPGFKLTVTAKLNGQTGVEMEALTGVSIGLLTIYDMLKAIDKGMVIKEVQLEHKSGGKSGDFHRA